MSVKIILKKILLVWGGISLILVLIIGILIGVMLINQHHRTAVEYQPTTEEKTFGEFTLKTTKNDTANPEIIHVTINQKDQSILDKYRLPIEKYGLSYGVNIDSVVIVKSGQGGNGIILISSYSECACESNNQYLWFLGVKDSAVKIIDVLELSDFRLSHNDPLTFTGNRHITIDESPRAHFIIPLKIIVDDAVQITPLLSHDGLSLVNESFGTVSAHIIDEMKKSGDTTLVNRIQQSKISFQKAISNRVIKF